MSGRSDARRGLPAVGSLLEAPDVAQLITPSNRPLVTRAAREVIAEVRRGDQPPPDGMDGWVTLLQDRLQVIERPSLRRVLNATGVVLHTNLGRAPLPLPALHAIATAAAGGCNLEYDIARGARGSRHVHATALLRELTGAEDAMVVNNCAAALVLALQVFAADREAIVSRGELIEIGGSFRVPDIMETSGARLREVGTTNRTHLADYAAAIGPATGALVKVHRSNFEQRGFVTEASIEALAPLARTHDLPLLFDFGSGLLLDLAPWGLGGEPTARDAVQAGATLVLMSGDKLLGGPQAGIVLGTAAAVERCRRHPLARALRVDKLTLAALEATLALYRHPDLACRSVPVLAMLTAPVASVQARAAAMLEPLHTAGIGATVVATEATVGGGAFPTARIASAALALDDGARWERALRAGEPPVVGRLDDGRLLLDLRSLPVDEDEALLAALCAAQSA